MLYSEEAARANVRSRDGRRVFFLGKDDNLTSAARDYLRRERIEILPAEAARPERFALLGGGYCEEKPEHMTHLNGVTLAPKTHPRILFRGKVDTLEAQLILCRLRVPRFGGELKEILDYTRRALNAYCPGGHFIPSITYGLAGTVFPHVDQYLDQAVNEYNAGLHIPVTPLPAVPKRKISEAKAETVQAAASAQESADVFENIARALERGQQKKLLTLCQQALDEGCGPGDILSKGMIVGMNRLGEAFSANRAFVPEMLMAARCMSAATELLKPLMVGEGTEPVGRVCLGTVKGDMHDIGKNLVKIMMEGSGIEVFDLGVDTSAEQFVSTAVENHCGVIACSSLLTTTMEEMREVVKLVHERGLQDQIKVMVGGAPISQSFCDEIGADYYAEDAGAAAREAVKILKVQKAS